MNRRKFLTTVASVGAGLSIPAFLRGMQIPSSSNAKKPNIVFISIEDVAHNRFGFAGNPIAKTPHLDAFSKTCQVFDRSYCNAAACVPSRTSMTTGLRPESTGITGNFTPNRFEWMEDPDAVNLSGHFKKNGYETTIISKFYQRNHSPSIDNEIDTNDNMPEQPKSLPLGGIPKGQKQTPFRFGVSGRKDHEEDDWRAATHAINALKEKGDKPLFLGVGIRKPHLPLSVPQEYFDLYDIDDIKLPDFPENDLDDLVQWVNPDYNIKPFSPMEAKKAIQSYYASMSFADKQVGRILDYLKESGEIDDTIVVIWSDHGFMLGEHNCWAKGLLFEESVSCMLMIHAPGVTQAGTRCKRVTEAIDLFPTVSDLAGLPDPKGIEGISMRPILENPNAPWKKGAITYVGEESNGRCITTERYRYIEWKDVEGGELYDLEKDPREFTNVANNPDYASVVKELESLLEQGWKACLPE